MVDLRKYYPLESMQNERTVRVKKDELLTTLHKNRADHVEAFTEASKKWSEDMENISKDLVSNPTDENTLAQLQRIWNQKPKSYAEEYDLAIAQMDMEIRTELELSLHEFNQLVSDKWAWMHHFAANDYSSASLTAVKAKRKP